MALNQCRQAGNRWASIRIGGDNDNGNGIGGNNDNGNGIGGDNDNGNGNCWNHYLSLNYIGALYDWMA